MATPKDLRIKIFADGAEVDAMKATYRQGIVKGFTTNPTLMRKAGVVDYEVFARNILEEITDLPISFEVFSDDFAEMERQARIIARWGSNVNIKIPITNTSGSSSMPLIKKLSADGLSLNITAVFTLDQVSAISEALAGGVKSIVSIFAGRIADTGFDPMPLMKDAAAILKSKPDAELLWASSRELLNIFQAQECGCDIITVTDDILKKLNLVGKDLSEFSLETVKMFYEDARAASFTL
jgi:transaldolase